MTLLTSLLGGGSAPEWTTSDPRSPIASPHSKSDIFPGASLNAKWTQTNMAGATLTVARNRVIIATPSAGGTNFNMRVVSQPVETPPWSIRARFTLPAHALYHGLGLFVGDASGKYVTVVYRVNALDNELPTQFAVQVEYMNSVTSRNANVRSRLASTPTGVIWVRLRDDGTNLYADYSWDGDDDSWVNYWSAARAAFISATQTVFGFFVDNLSSAAYTGEVQSFRVANSA